MYAIPHDAIPATGRDVQCSNCNHIWFARSKDISPYVAPPAEIAPPPETAPLIEMQLRNEISAEVRAVLKEEVGREIAARQAEAAAALAVAPDAGIAEKTASDDAPIQNMSKADTAPAEIPLYAPAQDILHNDHADDPAQTFYSAKSEPAYDVTPAARKTGFRWGVLTAVIIMTVMAGLYTFASEIASFLPQYAYYIDLYAVWVNDLRLNIFQWADTLVTHFQSDPAPNTNDMNN